MTREDLFLAIGEVEESRLSRCENLSASNVTALEEGTMKQKTTKRRPLRLVLIAAVMVCMIAAVALVSAAPEVQLDPYETPEPMLEAAFGINGYPHEDGAVYLPEGEVNTVHIPAYDRVALDQDLAKESVSLYIYKIGESQTHNGDTLTVEAAVFDPVSGVGVLYYSIENPNGVTGYALQKNGEIWWPEGERIYVNYPSKGYIATAATTDEKLYVVEYYAFSDDLRDDMKTLIQQAGDAGLQEMIPEILQEVRGEVIRVSLRGADVKIDVPVDGMGGMEAISLGDNAVWLSPIGIRLYGQKLDMLNEAGELLLDSLVIRYADGSEYIIDRDSADANKPSTMNYAYGVQESDGVLIYALNRIVDVEQVASVVVNGIEFPVDQN